MYRPDDALAFILKYENVAWYDDGAVRILDRRIYPMETRYVVCRSYTEVAQAIADMVTQSGGPYVAAAMGMVLAAHEAEPLTIEAFESVMAQAAYTLSHARPTTSAKMVEITEESRRVAVQARRAGASAVDAAFASAMAYLNDQYERCDQAGRILADLTPDGGRVMTQCWAETVLGTMLRWLRRQGKDSVQFFCPETRPYFQGARLTASCICDMGFDVTVITDNMPGYVLRNKQIDLFTSAADVICMDGTIVNKVGTFQIALCAREFRVPYYVTGTPSFSHPDVTSVQIEERDPELVLHALDRKITMEGVKGYYPAFDVTPPSLCSGYATPKGLLTAAQLADYASLA